MDGGCLCGRVRYRIRGEPRAVVACHCLQCRKSSGHYVAATQARRADIEIRGLAHVTWYRSSASAQRGFCALCGSQLFWAEASSEFMSVMAGTIDGASGLRMDRQIHPDSKGDYYDLPDVPVIDQTALRPRLGRGARGAGRPPQPRGLSGPSSPPVRTRRSAWV